MELKPMYQRVIGLDVHQAKISACALAQQPDGTVTIEQREFGAFKRDRKALAQWAREVVAGCRTANKGLSAMFDDLYERRDRQG